MHGFLFLKRRKRDAPGAVAVTAVRAVPGKTKTICKIMTFMLSYTE